MNCTMRSLGDGWSIMMTRCTLNEIPTLWEEDAVEMSWIVAARLGAYHLRRYLGELFLITNFE